MEVSGLPAGAVRVSRDGRNLAAPEFAPEERKRFQNSASNPSGSAEVVSQNRDSEISFT
jgi:hypothetical protein